MSPTLLAWHRWLGLVMGAMILVAAGTALALNHQDLLLQRTQAQAAQSPYGRPLLSVLADPREPSRVLAGTEDGLFRSADGGRRWEEVVLPVPAEHVVALEADAAHPGVVYAAFRAIGLYVSQDGGELWDEVALPFDPTRGPTLQALDVTATGDLVVMTPEALYRRHGETWARVAAPASAQEHDARGPLKLVYALHDGKFWGTWGVPLTDAVSLALIALVATGYATFLARELKKRLARRRRASQRGMTKERAA